MKGGGYICSIDHSVHPEVPEENYAYFMSLLDEYGVYANFYEKSCDCEIKGGAND